MSLVNEREAAELLACSVHTLQKSRRIGSKIPYKKIGRNVRYDKKDIEVYLEQQTFSSTSEYN